MLILLEYLFSMQFWRNEMVGQISRAVAALLSGGLLTIVVTPTWTRFLVKTGISEPIKDYEGLSPLSKKGTPIMGGVAIVVSFCIAILIFSDVSTISVIAVLVTSISFASIGLADDLLKTKPSRKGQGLSQKQKYLIQFFAISVVLVLVHQSSISSIGSRHRHQFPFLLDTVQTGLVTWVIVSMVFAVFFTNSTNITDGMDGLLSFPVSVCALVLCIISFLKYEPELAIAMAAIAGAYAGFLWHNSFPAAVFMGDTGSLPAGAALAVAGIHLGVEPLVLLAGGLFVIEGLSSLLQSYIAVALFGRRLFFRAPVHHNWQYKGMSEPKIVIRAWLISLTFSVVALLSALLRFSLG